MRFFRHWLALGILLLALLPAGCRKASDPTAEWVSRCLAAHGGEAALRRVRTLVWQGEITAIGGRHGESTILLKIPGELRTVLDYGKSGEDRILSDGKGWRNAGSGFVAVTGPPLAAMIFQYRHLTLPLGLLDADAQVSWAGEEKAGTSEPRLRVLRPGEPELLVDIDAQSGLVRRVTGRLQIGGQQTELVVAYGGYRQVEGVQVPTLITNFAGGMEIARSQFPRVAVNSELPATTFDPAAAMAAARPE